LTNQIQGEQVGNNPELEQFVPEITGDNLKDLEIVTSTRSTMWIPIQQYYYAALLLDDNLNQVDQGKAISCITILDNDSSESGPVSPGSDGSFHK